MAKRSPDGRAVFLDRDGVLVPDAGLSRSNDASDLLPGVGEAVGDLNEAGWVVVVVTNQPAVARGWLTENEVLAQHERIDKRIRAGGGHIDGFFFCPHHPDADVDDYRVHCECRKPRPGLLVQAAESLGLDLAASAMVGDRMTDVETGFRAGCRLNILVESGMHREPRIVTDVEELPIEPHARVSSLLDATHAILQPRSTGAATT